MSAMALYGQLTGRSRAEAIEVRGNSWSGFFSRDRRGEDVVKEGSRFFRHRPDRMLETATVLSVSSDRMGIPHVRYNLEIQKLRGTTKFSDGPRSLALETFMSTYRAES